MNVAVDADGPLFRNVVARGCTGRERERERTNCAKNVRFCGAHVRWFWAPVLETQSAPDQGHEREKERERDSLERERERERERDSLSLERERDACVRDLLGTYGQACVEYFGGQVACVSRPTSSPFSQKAACAQRSLVCLVCVCLSLVKHWAGSGAFLRSKAIIDSPPRSWPQISSTTRWHVRPRARALSLSLSAFLPARARTERSCLSSGDDQVRSGC